MRIKIAVLAAGMIASAVAAMPASAQRHGGYRDSCEGVRSGNQGAGLVLGGLLGGLAGNQIAAKGRRSEGTAVGAILGGVVGSAIGGSRDNCDTYRQNEVAYPQPYPQPLPPPPAPVYRDNYPSYDPGYRDDGYYGRDEPSHRRYSDDSYGRGGYRDSDYVKRECTITPQITKMPDGSKVVRDVEVCREIRAGDWHEH